ncbi:MAG: lytic transglycosylase domain-containing protein [Bacillota bacterium]
MVYTICWLAAVAVILIAPIAARIFFPFPYKQIIHENCFRYSLDPLLVISIIKVESSFNPAAHSPKGALGLMQVMPDTGAWIATRRGMEFSLRELSVPVKNIEYGCWYLNYLNREFLGKLPLVLCAYNSGHLHVQTWLRQKTWSGDPRHAEQIPFEETRVYLKKVLWTYAWYKRLYGKNYSSAGADFPRLRQESRS